MALARCGTGPLWRWPAVALARRGVAGRCGAGPQCHHPCHPERSEGSSAHRAARFLAPLGMTWDGAGPLWRWPAVALARRGAGPPWRGWSLRRWSAVPPSMSPRAQRGVFSAPRGQIPRSARNDMGWRWPVVALARRGAGPSWRGWSLRRWSTVPPYHPERSEGSSAHRAARFLMGRRPAYPGLPHVRYNRPGGVTRR